MGFFDDFGGIFSDLKELGDELQGIKDEFVSSVVDPTGELRDAVSGIASDLTGQAQTIKDDITGGITDVTAAASDVTRIPISDITNK